jgi:hypothetical protein
MVGSEDGTSADVYVRNADAMTSCNTTLSIKDSDVVGVKAKDGYLEFYTSDGQKVFEYPYEGTIDSLTLEGSERCDVNVYLPGEVYDKLTHGSSFGDPVGVSSAAGSPAADGDDAGSVKADDTVLSETTDNSTSTDVTKDETPTVRIVSVNADYNSDNNGK